MHYNLGLGNERRFIFLPDLRNTFFFPWSELFQIYCTCILQGKQSITLFSAKLIGHLDQYLSTLDCFPVPAFILQHVSFQNSSFILPFALFYFLQTDILGQCLLPQSAILSTFIIYLMAYILLHTSQDWEILKRNSISMDLWMQIYNYFNSSIFCLPPPAVHTELQ